MADARGGRGLQVGTEYRVTFEDCCISGTFVDTFVGWGDGGDPEQMSGQFDEDEHSIACFIEARVGAHWANWTAEEVRHG